jgi:RimJ/RimL family protein N-acetyltransferase
MSQPFPEHLASSRLRLRRLTSHDAAALSAYRSLPEVARYQSWDRFQLEDATHLIETQQNAEPNIPGTWFQLAIVTTGTDCIIGDCGLHCLKDDPHQVEIGITLAPEAQGCGYAAEAIACALDYLFANPHLHRAFAVTDHLNLRAISLFQRLGFRQEANPIDQRWFKGRWSSELIFAVLQREWPELQNNRKSHTYPGLKGETPL